MELEVSADASTNNLLDRDLNWTGKLVGLKVPVVYLSVFPDHIRLPLAQSEFTLV